MSYGGGYSKTGYGTQGGDDGGGFMAGSQQGSQGGGGSSKAYGDESLRPVTIKQIADWSEPFPGAEVKIDDAPLTQLTIVGQIRKINPQATNITYTLDDGTATIDVKKWVDAERAAEDGGGGADGGQQFAEDQYVRVWGRLKSFNGKKHVGAHFIRAVEDFNEVNYHLVEAAYVHLYITKGPPVPSQAPADGQQKQQQQQQHGESMFVDDGYGGGGGGAGGDGEETPQQKLARAGPSAKRVFAYLNNTPGGNEGVSAHMIANGIGLSTREVFNATDELNQLGLVYTTVDDETFAILEY